METIGSLIDKLCINELKIYHMSEQILRSDVSEDFVNQCKDKVSVLKRQRDMLSEELQTLYEDIVAGRKNNVVFRQCKMYNEKQYRD